MIAGSYGNFIFNMLGNYLFPTVTAPFFLYSYQWYIKVVFLHILIIMYFLFFFDNNLSNGPEVLSHCSLHLLFPND